MFKGFHISSQKNGFLSVKVHSVSFGLGPEQVHLVGLVIFMQVYCTSFGIIVWYFLFWGREFWERGVFMV